MSGPRLSEPQWQALESAAEARYSLPSGVLRTTRGIESQGRDVPGKPTKYGVAQGYYQSMPATVAKYGFNPHDPESAVDGTARLWRDNLTAAGGNVQEAARMYNGSGPEARAYAAKFMGKQGGGKSAPININDMGFSEPDKPNIADMGFSDPGAAPAKATPQGAPAQAAPAQTDAGDTAPQDELTKARAEIDAMAGDKPASPSDVVKDPVSGQSAPAIDPDSKQPFLGWGASNDQRYPMYGDPGKPSDSIPDNLGQGASMGLQDMFEGTLGKGGQWLENKVPALRTADEFLNRTTGSATADQVVADYNKRKALYDLTAGTTASGSIGRIGGQLLAAAPGVSMAGGAVGAGLEAAGAPAAADFMGGTAGTNLLTRAASRGASGAFQGATGAALLSGQSDASLGSQMAGGAIGGAILGGGIGALGDGVGAVRNKLAPKVDEFTANLAQQALDRGIPVGAGQLSSNPMVRSANTLLGKVGALGDFQAQQREAMNAAMARASGVEGSNFTPEAMTAARKAVGGDIGAIAARNHITDTSKLIDDLSQVEQNARGTLENAAPINQQISNVMNKIDADGGLSGESYNDLIRHNGPLDLLTENTDSGKRNLGLQIRQALDDALEKHANPGDIDALRAKRLTYKNLMTLAPLAVKAQAEGGSINPALLPNAVARNFKGQAFSGADELGTLGNIARRFITPAPSSNSAENNMLLQGGLTAIKYAGGAGMGMLGFQHGLPPMEAMAGGALSAGAAALAARGARSLATNPNYTNRLIGAATGDVAPSAPGIIANSAPTVSGNKLMQAFNDNFATRMAASPQPNAPSQKDKSAKKR